MERERIRTVRSAICGWLASALLFVPAVAVAVPVAPDHGWLFDDGSGASASALTGGQDGVLQGGVGWSPDTPFGSYAGNFSLLLDGVDDFVDVPGLSTVLNGSTSFTISFWIQSDQTGQDRAFFSGAAPGNSDTFGARYDSNAWLPSNNATELLKFGLMVDGTNYQYESSGGLQADTWQHVVFSWSNTDGVTVWVDGVRDTPSATTAYTFTGTEQITNQTHFLIGDGPKANWQGRIDEVAVWSTALSDTDVDWLLNNSLADGFLPVPEPATATLLLGGLTWLAVMRRNGTPRSR
jgi:hypothetical protein